MKNQSPPAAVALGMLLLYVGGPHLSATPVKEEKARQAVEYWVRHKTADKRANANIEKLEPHKINGQTTAFIVHLKGGGYCIAGADTLTLPVYWYCPDGNYDPGNPGCQEILREISQRTEFLRNETAKGGEKLGRYKQALKHREAIWGDLSPGGTPPTGQLIGDPNGPGVLTLPLTTTWNQTPPYNALCPAAPAGSANRTVVGCVATAMAQVMAYWRWPNTGVGSAGVDYECRWRAGEVGTPFPFSPFNPGDTSWNKNNLSYLTWDGTTLWISGGWDDTLLTEARNISGDSRFQDALNDLYDHLPAVETHYSADFGSTTYRWDLIQNSHGALDGGGLETAKISFHAGLAVGMDYGLSQSGIPYSDIPDALVDHFRYDADADADDCDANEMAEEIEWMRPCFMRGRTDSAGHCWVVYGYNKGSSSWQFKMNLGWGGGSDGWYTLDDVPQGFNGSQGQVTRVAPNGIVKFVGAASSGDGTPDSPYRNLEEAVDRAANGSTLILRANSVNTFSSPALFINRPLTLKGINVTITR